ncbi:MAG TPA: FtsX-like permease family protein [Acidimicrobiales bacterium]|nr:FtsX-like permease family protein [Acidimicrobiales bacterium]
MTTTLERPPAVEPRPAGGGAVARRAMYRWSWRLFRREWRQQVLILALVIVAVAATVVGSAVATDQPPPANAGFGTAQDLATFGGSDPKMAAQIAALQQRFGRVQVIENQVVAIPGSIRTFTLRAQDPHGPFGAPMLALVSGRYPAGPGEVAITSGVAADFGLKVGDLWHVGGSDRRVVGIVENPQSLLEEFALVYPGTVPDPTQVIVLFDAPGLKPGAIGPNVATPASVALSNPLNPETISLTVLTVGMLLIALVAVGGFTVVAQRRLRSLGMLASTGASDRHVRLVVRANGLFVGVIGAAIGTALGLVLWLAYRPHLETSAHHRIGTWSLPWPVVGAAVVLAIVATYLAAARPARAITKVPVVAALSGRPAPPKQVHRSAIPGIVFMAAAFLLLGYAGATNHGSGSGGSPELVVGIMLLIPGVILLAPFFLTVLARLGRNTPIAVRLALRDLARYRARSGSALAAISLGVMIAVIIACLAAARYGNVMDWAGPNLASNQLVVYSAFGSNGGPISAGQLPTAAEHQAEANAAQSIGTALGSQHVVELVETDAGISGTSGGRQFNGQLYVATPQLLRAFGIDPSSVSRTADILSMRPGFSGITGLSLSWCTAFGSPAKSVGPGGGPGGGVSYNPCTSSHDERNPEIQEVSALPPGTSAPNTVLTEHAVTSLGLQTDTNGWLIETSHPLTAVQIHDAQAAAAAAGMTIESKNDQPTSSEVINWATVFGIALALCVLAMSVGLIRAETAGDLRTLAATGASSRTRRTLTAATAGGLGLLGAVLGTLAGYVGMIGFLRSNSLNGGISALGNVPVANLLVILVGIPFAAATIGWLLAGREPVAMARQPIE